MPNLILRSDRSVLEAPDPDAIQRGDAVLDVQQIARWAGCVGDRQTIAPITDAKHDVFLSLAEPRAAAYLRTEPLARRLPRALNHGACQHTSGQD